MAGMGGMMGGGPDHDLKSSILHNESNRRAVSGRDGVGVFAIRIGAQVLGAQSSS
jgi:hypothetical protein